jgi:hypothetical protein
MRPSLHALLAERSPAELTTGEGDWLKAIKKP